MTLADIYDFLKEQQGISEKTCVATYDLERDMGITGDDFVELIEAFAREFDVDMRSYRWYFHHSEELTFNPGALFFKSPDCRVEHIPVTPLLLLEAANKGYWPVEYPEHTLPACRYDIYFSYAFLAVLALAVMVIFLVKMF